MKFSHYCANDFCFLIVIKHVNIYCCWLSKIIFNEIGSNSAHMPEQFFWNGNADIQKEMEKIEDSKPRKIFVLIYFAVGINYLKKTFFDKIFQEKKIFWKNFIFFFECEDHEKMKKWQNSFSLTKMKKVQLSNFRRIAKPRISQQE